MLLLNDVKTRNCDAGRRTFGVKCGILYLPRRAMPRRGSRYRMPDRPLVVYNFLLYASIGDCESGSFEETESRFKSGGFLLLKCHTGCINRIAVNVSGESLLIALVR